MASRRTSDIGRSIGLLRKNCGQLPSTQSPLLPFPTQINTSGGKRAWTFVAGASCRIHACCMISTYPPRGSTQALLVHMPCVPQLVIAAYRMPLAVFPAALDRMRLSAFDLSKVIQPFVKTLAAMPQVRV